ncbi:MAG: transcriptional repressor [Sedimentisphaerales bacterium]|nr:transcriptional repressor [Sedimentisphaerales bacterium]
MKHDKAAVETFFQAKCRDHGLKITPQRLAIYRELVKSKEHPSAEILYKRVKKKLPNISFDTVYRTLLTLSQVGLTRVVEGTGEPKRFDPHMDKHHHMKCIKCNAIIDFQEDSYERIEIPSRIRKCFNVLNKIVVLEGLCQKCN